MANLSKGLLAAAVSNLLFSMLPPYGMWMKLMTGTEMLAWRVVAMLSALCVLMTMVNGWQAAMRFAYGVGRDQKRWLLIVLPTPISVSRLWLFIWGLVSGEGINIAMGYFLFPLVMMLGGRIWFKERLNRLQRAAVVLACADVACGLVRSGAFPWTIVWVFDTYPFYYLLCRKLGVSSLIGLTFDLVMITPFALAYIVLTAGIPVMIVAKPVLVFFIVLLSFNSAISMHLNLKTNQLLPVVVFGMLNYLEPVLLFIVLIVWLGESVQSGVLIGYGLIWSGSCVMIASDLLGMKKGKKLTKFD